MHVNASTGWPSLGFVGSAMDLLPRDFDEFRSVEYWDRFFRERGEQPFEWYGEWCQLKPFLMPICKRRNILVAGCGNSELSSQM